MIRFSKLISSFWSAINSSKGISALIMSFIRRCFPRIRLLSVAFFSEVIMGAPEV